MLSFESSEATMMSSSSLKLFLAIAKFLLILIMFSFEKVAFNHFEIYLFTKIWVEKCIQVV